MVDTFSYVLATVNIVAIGVVVVKYLDFRKRALEVFSGKRRRP